MPLINILNVINIIISIKLFEISSSLRNKRMIELVFI